MPKNQGQANRLKEINCELSNFPDRTEVPKVEAMTWIILHSTDENSLIWFARINKQMCKEVKYSNKSIEYIPILNWNTLLTCNKNGSHETHSSGKENFGHCKGFLWAKPE